MEKLPKKVETPKREETKPLQNQAKLEQTETKQGEEKVFLSSTQNTQEKKEVVKSELNVRDEAFKLIARNEGFREKPYWDSVRWAYGYGQPAPHKNATITKEESKKYVYGEIDKWISQYYLGEYPKGVQIALLSFRYNVGHLPSGTKRYLDRNDLKGLANKMKEYVYSDGKKLPGLVNRRTEETNYFLN